MNAIYQQYKDAYGKEQGDAIYTEELIAHIAGDLLSDTDAISRIVADKPSVARRMLDTIRNFINRIKGVNDPFVDQLRKVEKLMTKALEESDRKYRKSLSDMGIEVVDGNAVKYSLSSWTDSERNTARQSLLALGHDEATVDKWLNDVDSVAATIAADQDRLDFDPAEEHTMLKSNQEYVKTVDASTLCAKRLLYLYSLNAASENKKGTVYEGMAVSDTTSSSSSISISDLLELVKNKFGDGFSSDVLNNLGIERPEGQYGKNAKYALPSSSLLNYQINNWRNASEQQAAKSLQNQGFSDNGIIRRQQK